MNTFVYKKSNWKRITLPNGEFKSEGGGIMTQGDYHFLNFLHKAHEEALREQLNEGKITKPMYYAQCRKADKTRREIIEAGVRKR